jgi:hypothetical protein
VRFGGGGEAEVAGGVGDGEWEEPGWKGDGRQAAGETPQRHGCGGRTVAQSCNLNGHEFVNVTVETAYIHTPSRALSDNKYAI